MLLYFFPNPIKQLPSAKMPNLEEKLQKHTSFFGVRLWILILISSSLLTFLLIFVPYLCIIFCRRRNQYKTHFCLPNPAASRNSLDTPPLDRGLLSRRSLEIEMNMANPEHQLLFPDRCSSKLGSGKTSGRSTFNDRYVLVVSETWRGSTFTLNEIEMITNGFSNENMIGKGNYGTVFRGMLLDVNARVAVKVLLSDSRQVEDFPTVAEAIGHVRHKNIVKLVGYCMEANHRILVYEFIDNGNLYQWLHGSPGQARPLTWDTRMKIIQGIAKGLAYLHEDVVPKIAHQNIKSRNILLDHQWTPKISDVALVRFMSPSYNSLLIAHAIVDSGYIPPEYAPTGILNEQSDVYSFGILIMEIVSGRAPVDHTQPQLYLVDWLKSMVESQKISHVMDPKLPDLPSIKELKRIILIALRCVDPDVKHRPKMGDVIHMLEPRDLLLNDEFYTEMQKQNPAAGDDAFNVKAGKSEINAFEKLMGR